MSTISQQAADLAIAHIDPFMKKQLGELRLRRDMIAGLEIAVRIILCVRRKFNCNDVLRSV